MQLENRVRKKSESCWAGNSQDVRMGTLQVTPGRAGMWG